jgi:hypothetical protein
MTVMAYDMKCMTEDFTVIREEVHECYGISMQEFMTVMAYGKKCMTEYFPDCYVRRNS